MRGSSDIGKKQSHWVRYVLVIVGVLVLVGALVGIKGSQIGSLIAYGNKAAKAGPPPEAVSTATAAEQVWEGTLSAVGSVAAVRGVALSNDAPGIVQQILFESGDLVRQGQVLVKLDSRVEEAQLQSSASRRELAEINAKRTQTLVSSGAVTKSQLDNDSFGLKTAEKDVTALQTQIDRKIVRAPFAGRLGIRQVNLGQYLNPGTQIATLEAIDSVYVDFSLPQQVLNQIKVGMPVRVEVEGADQGPSEGVIAAIDPEVDALTRALKLRASVPNKAEKLRPGMFANVTVILPPQPAQVAVPATAVVHAAYGDSVFIVEAQKADGGAPLPNDDGKPATVARQQFVRLGESRGDFVAILDGVKANDTVVTAGAFKLYNGAPVKVDNTVKSAASLEPHPVNR